MIDSLKSIMPHSGDTRVFPSSEGGKRAAPTWPSASGSGDNGKCLSPCKKRKKTHKWMKKSRPRVSRRSKAKKGFRTKPEAPFNSTQFIMDEHDNLNDSDLSSSRPRRHRDSSLSMESAEDFLEDEVSSDDNEDEFMTQQFWSAYEDYHAERLDAMSKPQLVQEYFALEERLNLLEKQLREAQEQDRRRIRAPSPFEDGGEGEVVPGEVPLDPETAAKLEIFRSEIQKLEEENSRLRAQNSALRRVRRRCEDEPSNTSSSSDGDCHRAPTPPPQAPSPVLPALAAPRVGTSDEEFELCGTPLKITNKKGLQYSAVDSGIASSATSSSEEEVRARSAPPGGLPQPFVSVPLTKVLLQQS